MNTPTTIEKLLIGYLKLSNASETAQTLIFLMLETEDQMFEMCRFLKENPDATGLEIAQAATRILEQFPEMDDL